MSYLLLQLWRYWCCFPDFPWHSPSHPPCESEIWWCCKDHHLPFCSLSFGDWMNVQSQPKPILKNIFSIQCTKIRKNCREIKLVLFIQLSSQEGRVLRKPFYHVEHHSIFCTWHSKIFYSTKVKFTAAQLDSQLYRFATRSEVIAHKNECKVLWIYKFMFFIQKFCSIYLIMTKCHWCQKCLSRHLLIILFWLLENPEQESKIIPATNVNCIW